jgi:hypothetical protein
MLPARDLGNEISKAGAIVWVVYIHSGYLKHGILDFP